ncbi:MAG: hypothetical protein BAJALOKI1v1_1450002 [Promethearchaeota archaeon]|nr:MAG: hypothetical protein BAJALOKI1v1_1450002 [Candidatus Lokiarchaeota archaeon]
MTSRNNEEDIRKAQAQERIDEFLESFNLNINEKISQELISSYINNDSFKNKLDTMFSIKNKQLAVISSFATEYYEDQKHFTLLLCVIDRETFHPLPNAHVSVYFQNFPEESITGQTNSSGVCQLKIPLYYERNTYVMDITAEGYDVLTTRESQTLQIHKNLIVDNIYQKILLFTDRTQYKPGDSIRGLIWVIEEYRDYIRVSDNTDFEIKLIKDIHGEKVFLSFKYGATNDFGYCEFELKTQPEFLEGKYILEVQLRDSSREDERFFATQKEIEIKHYRRPEIESQLKNLPNSWFVKKPLEFDITAHYFYGEPINEGSIIIEIIDLAGISLKLEPFPLLNSEAHIRIDKSKEQIKLASGIGKLLIIAEDAHGRRGSLKEEPLIIVKEAIMINIKAEHFVLSNDGIFEADPALIIECFDYEFNLIDCFLDITIYTIDQYKKKYIQEKYNSQEHIDFLHIQQETKNGIIKIKVTPSEKDLFLDSFDRYISIACRNEKYDDEFEIESVINIKIEHPKKVESKTNEEKKDAQLKVQLPQKVDQATSFICKVSGSFQKGALFHTSFHKNKLYHNEFFMAPSDAYFEKIFHLPDHLTGDALFTLYYFGILENNRFAKKTEKVCQIIPIKKILKPKLAHPKVAKPGETISIYLEESSNIKNVKDIIFSGMLIDKASHELSKYKYPDLLKLMIFPKNGITFNTINPMELATKDVQEILEIFLLQCSYSFDLLSFITLYQKLMESLQSSFKKLKDIDILAKLNFSLAKLLKCYDLSLQLELSDKDKLILLNKAFTDDKIKLPLEFSHSLNSNLSTLSKRAKLEISAFILHRLETIIIKEKYLPPAWNNLFSKYSISNENLYTYYIEEILMKKGIELWEEYLSYSREKILIEALITSFQTNFEQLILSLKDIIRNSQNSEDLIKPQEDIMIDINSYKVLTNEFLQLNTNPNWILELNEFIKSIKENKCIIIENGSRFLKVGTNWDYEKTELIDSVVGYPKYTSIMTDVDHYSRESYSGGAAEISDLESSSVIPTKMEKEKKKKTETIRKVFDELGWWKPFFSLDDMPLSLKIPDSTTTQELYLIASNKDADVGDYLGEIIVKQEFFLNIRYPPNISQNDKFEIKIIVNNLTSETFVTNFSWKFSNNLYTDSIQGLAKDDPNKKINANDSISFIIICEAVTPGVAHLEITADSKHYKDTIIEQFQINPIGLPFIETHTGILEEGDEFTMQIPISSGDYVVKSFLTVLPSNSSFIIDSAKNLLNYHYSCNEQVSSMLSAAVNILQISEGAASFPEDLIETYYNVLEKCIQKLILGRNEERLWGWWRNESTDLFLSCLIHDTLLTISDFNISLLYALIRSTIKTLGDILEPNGNIKEEVLQSAMDSKRTTKKLSKLHYELFLANSFNLQAQIVGDVPYQYKKLKHRLLLTLEEYSTDDPYLLFLIGKFYLTLDVPMEEKCEIIVDHLLSTTKSVEGGIYWDNSSCPFSNLFLTSHIGIFLLEYLNKRIDAHQSKKEKELDKEAQKKEFISSTPKLAQVQKLIFKIATYIRNCAQQKNRFISTIERCAILFYSKLPYSDFVPMHITLSTSLLTPIKETKKSTYREDIYKTSSWEIDEQNYEYQCYELSQIPIFRYPFDTIFENHPQPIKVQLKVKVQKDESKIDQDIKKAQIRPFYILETQRWNRISLETQNTELLTVHKDAYEIERIPLQMNCKINESIAIQLKISNREVPPILRDTIIIEEPIPAGFNVFLEELRERYREDPQVSQIFMQEGNLIIILNQLLTKTLEYEMRANYKGRFSQNLSFLYPMYSPEFQGVGNPNNYHVV